MVTQTKNTLFLLREIKAALEQSYGDRLVAVILYGSSARGQATDGSDVDVAVVLRGKVNKLAEIGQIHDLIYDLESESGELISFYPLSEAELEDVEWPLHAHICEEGVAV